MNKVYTIKEVVGFDIPQLKEEIRVLKTQFHSICNENKLNIINIKKLKEENEIMGFSNPSYQSKFDKMIIKKQFIIDVTQQEIDIIKTVLDSKKRKLRMLSSYEERQNNV